MGDFIAYAVIVTPERQQLAAFTVPVISGLKQVIVSGPNFGKAACLDDLGGKQVYVNPLTANYQLLQDINRIWQSSGKSPIEVKASDPNLTEEDILQMVSAGVVPATVTNMPKATLWGASSP